MSLKKQFLKSKPICKVTFCLMDDEVQNAKKIQLLGSFNAWKIKDAVLLKKFKNGSFKVTIDLETEQEYQFKYLVDGEKWVNDEMADKYVSNGIGHEENSVVVL
jgi:1,4-alpha-glucan branching enzyme